MYIKYQCRVSFLFRAVHLKGCENDSVFLLINGSTAVTALHRRASTAVEISDATGILISAFKL
jgi:hypothetical protein